MSTQRERLNKSTLDHPLKRLVKLGELNKYKVPKVKQLEDQIK